MTARTYETVWIEQDTKGPDGLVRVPKLPDGNKNYRVIKDGGVNCVVVVDADEALHTDMLKIAETKYLSDKDILAGKKTDSAEAVAILTDAKPIEAQPAGAKP